MTIYTSRRISVRIEVVEADDFKRVCTIVTPVTGFESFDMLRRGDRCPECIARKVTISAFSNHLIMVKDASYAKGKCAVTLCTIITGRRVARRLERRIDWVARIVARDTIAGHHIVIDINDCKALLKERRVTVVTGLWRRNMIDRLTARDPPIVAVCAGLFDQIMVKDRAGKGKGRVAVCAIVASGNVVLWLPRRRDTIVTG